VFELQSAWAAEWAWLRLAAETDYGLLNDITWTGKSAGRYTT